MKAIAIAIWRNPTVCAGALQATNTALAGAQVVPVWIALPISVLAAAANVAAVRIRRD